MARTLLGTITERATATFTEVDLKDKEAFKAWYNDASFQRWYNHWIEAGERFYEELISEGLTETASAVRDHIEWQRKHGLK